MKHYLVSLLFFLSFLSLTNCAEDEVLSTYMSEEGDIEAYGTLNPKTPVLNKVVTDGLSVTLEFTNNAAPKKPEGGFELMLNGKRTRTSITPRINSSEKNLTMTFKLDNPTTYRFQVYARWNTGYLGSNEVWGKVEKGAGAAPSGVNAPANLKEPVISNVITAGSKVTIEFVNFSAPKKPEGGFELMLDGKRTRVDITPRVNSDKKNLTMSFNLNNPQAHCYQIYARWNSGYLSSEEFCPGVDNGSSPETEKPSPTPDRNNNNNNNNNDDIRGMPALKLVKGYEFEDNIGRNVSQSRDGLKVHQLGRTDGKVVSEDGVGAYRFRITPNGVKNSYRQDLVPRDLPAPYFRNGFRAKWNQEYVYEMRIKFSENYDIGGEYISFFGAKNDYETRRLGSLTLHTEGDHYYARQYYATHNTTNRKGDGEVNKYYDADGNVLQNKVSFDRATKVGPGYRGVDNDKGKWITWTFRVKWTYDNSGFIKIYKNGQLFHSYNGPTSFKDQDAPYVMFGLYNSYWAHKSTGSHVQEAFVDYFRVYVPK